MKFVKQLKLRNNHRQQESRRYHNVISHVKYMDIFPEISRFRLSIFSPGLNQTVEIFTLTG